MTLDQAFELVSKYGGVTSDIMQLKAIAPTENQLKSVMVKMFQQGCSFSDVRESLMLVIEHHKLDICLGEVSLENESNSSK